MDLGNVGVCNSVYDKVSIAKVYLVAIVIFGEQASMGDKQSSH